MYFDQLSGAVHTRKLVEIPIFGCFQPFCLFEMFFSDFLPEINYTSVHTCVDCIGLFTSRSINIKTSTVLQGNIPTGG